MWLYEPTYLTTWYMMWLCDIWCDYVMYDVTMWYMMWLYEPTYLTIWYMMWLYDIWCDYVTYDVTMWYMMWLCDIWCDYSQRICMHAWTHVYACADTFCTLGNTSVCIREHFRMHRACVRACVSLSFSLSLSFFLSLSLSLSLCMIGIAWVHACVSAHVYACMHECICVHAHT